MRLQVPLLAEALLAAAIAAAAVSLAVPRVPRDLPGPAAPAVPVSPPPETPRPAPRAGGMASPEKVATLFGWKPPAPARPKPAPKPTAKPPAPPPPRLKVVGFVETAGAATSWVFKDAPTGIVLTLSPGETARGWTLVEVNEQEFVLSFQGVTTTVPRKR